MENQRVTFAEKRLI